MANFRMMFPTLVTMVLAAVLAVGCAPAAQNSTSSKPIKTTTPSKPTTANSTKPASQESQPKLNISLMPEKESWSGNTLTIQATLTVNQPLNLTQKDFQLTVGSAAYTPDPSSSIPASINKGSAQVILVYQLPSQVSAATLNLDGNHTLSLIIPKPVASQPKPQATPVKTTGHPAFITYRSYQTTVLVPYGWIPANISGGDWFGTKWVNPNDPNEYERLISSACVGCIMNPTLFAQGMNQIDLKSAIPETNVVGSFIFNSGNSIGYEYYPSNGDPYVGNGVLTVNYWNGTPDGSTFVNVVAPASEHAMVTQILNSFTTQ